MEGYVYCLRGNTLETPKETSMSSMSNTSSQGANPVTTILMVVALALVAIVTTRLHFVQGGNHFANLWILALAGVALIAQMIYCKINDLNEENDAYLFFGFIATIAIIYAASRLVHKFLGFKVLTNWQPGTAFWVLVGVIVVLLLGLILQNADGGDSGEN